MTRQGPAKHKVVSSGRLAGAGRAQTTRKRITGKTLSSDEPAYSLYSTDSEGQVTSIHKGLDRCAALLNGILQAEKTEAKPSSAKVGKRGLGQSRQLSTIRKDRGGSEKRKLTTKVEKPVSAPVQKTICSSQLNPEENNHGPVRTLVSISDARFNCRLTTSTPTLSPENLPPNGTGLTAPTRPLVPPSSSAPLAQHRDPILKVVPVQKGNAPFKTQLNFENGTTTHPSASSPHVAHTCCTSPISFGSFGTGKSGSLVHGACQKHFPQPYSPFPSMHPTEPIPRSCCHSPLLTLSQSQHPTQPQTLPQSAPQMEYHVHPNLQSQHQSHPLAQPQIQSYPDDPSPPWTGNKFQSVGTQIEETSVDNGWICEEGTAVDGIAEDKKEEECEVIFPIKENNAQTNFEKPFPAAHTCTNAHGLCIKPHMHLQSVHHVQSNKQTTAEPYPQHTLQRKNSDSCGPERTVRKVMTVQFLLGELKALLAGQDSAAERLVSDLELTVSLLPVMVGSSNIQAEIALVLQPLRNENAQLRRRLRILNQQLKQRERAEREARSLHSDTEMLTLQVELSDTQAHLQKLQLDNTQLRQALDDSKRKLEQNVEYHGHRLGECQRENVALLRIAKQRQAEIEKLQLLLRVAQGAMLESPAVNKSTHALTKQALDQYQVEQDSSEYDSDPVSLYLKSLDQKECRPVSPPCKGPVRVSQKDGGAETELPATSPLDGLLKAFHQSKEFSSHLNQLNVLFLDSPVVSNGPPNSHTLQGTALKVESSVLSREIRTPPCDWSVQSSSTFDTHDEQDFRNGLAALDASIASLQKNYQGRLEKIRHTHTHTHTGQI